MRRYQFIPVSRGGCNSYEQRLREEMRSHLISSRNPKGCAECDRLLVWGMRSACGCVECDRACWCGECDRLVGVGNAIAYKSSLT